MFRKHLLIVNALALAAAVVLLAAGPATAQHRDYGYGGYSHGGYYSHGYYPGHSGYYSHGYYPGHYGYYGHSYYPSYSHYGLGYYPGYYSSYYGSYAPGYYLYAPGYTYSATPGSYQAFYPSTGSIGAPAMPTGVDRVVHFDIRVPADAEIWFDGAKTESVGPAREFVSPALVPDHRYTYEIRARWKEGGREVTQTRRVTVHAGERVSLTFPEKAPEKSK